MRSAAGRPLVQWVDAADHHDFRIAAICLLQLVAEPEERVRCNDIVLDENGLFRFGEYLIDSRQNATRAAEISLGIEPTNRTRPVRLFHHLPHGRHLLAIQVMGPCAVRNHENQGRPRGADSGEYRRQVLSPIVDEDGDWRADRHEMPALCECRF
jgi:hypothetical protein